MNIENLVKIDTRVIEELRILNDRYCYDAESGRGWVDSISLEQHDQFLGVAMVLTLCLGEVRKLSARMAANGVVVKLQFLDVTNFRAVQQSTGKASFAFKSLDNRYACIFDAQVSCSFEFESLAVVRTNAIMIDDLSPQNENEQGE